MPLERCVRLVRQWLHSLYIPRRKYSPGHLGYQSVDSGVQNPQGDHCIHLYGPDDGQDGQWSDSPSVDLEELLKEKEPRSVVSYNVPTCNIDPQILD